MTKQVAAKAGVMAESTYDTYVEKNRQLKVTSKDVQAKVYDNMSDEAKKNIKETNEWFTEKKEQVVVGFSFPLRK